MKRRLLAVLVCGLGALLVMGEARAEPPGECPTWLPDLRCERIARYAGFSAPMSAPFLFEDPFITTGVSVWSIWQELPGRSVFRGGDLQAVAVQLRVALTDRLGLIATKDGRVKLNPDRDLLDSETGYLDLGFGLKYALIDAPERRFILTPSLRYEMSNGTTDVFSGNGEGSGLRGVCCSREAA